MSGKSFDFNFKKTCSFGVFQHQGLSPATKVLYLWILEGIDRQTSGSHGSAHYYKTILNLSELEVECAWHELKKYGYM